MLVFMSVRLDLDLFTALLLVLANVARNNSSRLPFWHSSIKLGVKLIL